eukprot:scaffold21366_cov54-Phaeocystis_antarctica.AAC.1
MRFLAVERRWQRQERVRNLPNARGSAGRAERETGVWRQAVVAVGHGCFSLLASRFSIMCTWQGLDEESEPAQVQSRRAV